MSEGARLLLTAARLQPRLLHGHPAGKQQRYGRIATGLRAKARGRG